ncbi:hypothetical protein [Bosea sp. (in: a-proteobacteria)]|uniref:hypothetical protein n=1 Tax=Bosea sp. (in: a-proteobacteria) TaxID=1871050 RepID=UPI002FC753E6
MTTITIEELRKLAAAGAVSLPASHGDSQADAARRESEALRPDQADRISELLRTARELAKRRSPEETAELERWLEERES